MHITCLLSGSVGIIIIMCGGSSKRRSRDTFLYDFEWCCFLCYSNALSSIIKGKVDFYQAVARIRQAEGCKLVILIFSTYSLFKEGPSVLV